MSVERFHIHATQKVLDDLQYRLELPCTLSTNTEKVQDLYLLFSPTDSRTAIYDTWTLIPLLTDPQAMAVAQRMLYMGFPIRRSVWRPGSLKNSGHGDCGGNLLKRFSEDELLTNIMIYWVTNSIGTSADILRKWKSWSL